MAKIIAAATTRSAAKRPATMGGFTASNKKRKLWSTGDAAFDISYKSRVTNIDFNYDHSLDNSQIMWNYHQMMAHHGIHTEDLRHIFKVLTGELGSRYNCIYLHGAGSRDKMAILEFFSAFYPPEQIGFIEDNGDNEDGDWMSDLVSKEFYHLDDVLMSKDNEVPLRMLLDGNKLLKTNYIGKYSTNVGRYPMIATNTESMWKDFPVGEEQMRKTMACYELKDESCPTFLYCDDRQKLKSACRLLFHSIM